MELLTHVSNLKMHIITGTCPFHYYDDALLLTGKDSTDFVEQLEKAIKTILTFLYKSPSSYKSGFNKCFPKSHDHPTVGGCIFLYTVYKLSSDANSKIINVIGGPYMFLDLPARTVAI